MTRAALLALALCAPAQAATVGLTMTVVDGRPVFRPADGLDCYTSKWGGQVTDCAEIDGVAKLAAQEPLWKTTMTEPEVIAAIFNGYDVPPSPVPLPPSGALMAAIVALALWGRRNPRTGGTV